MAFTTATVNTLSFAVQGQLVKSEWDAIDTPVAESEIKILEIICKGFSDVNYREGTTTTLIGFLKIESSSTMHDWLFNAYLKDVVQSLKEKYGEEDFAIDVKPVITIKKADMIRIQNTNVSKIRDVTEFIMLDIIDKMFAMRFAGDSAWGVQYFTLRLWS